MRIQSLILFGIYLITFGAGASASETELLVSRLRIDRWSAAEEVGETDESSMQQLARHMGLGHFFVRSAVIADRDLLADSARIYFVFPTAEAALSGSVAPRIVYRSPIGHDNEFKSGTVEEFIRDFTFMPGLEGLDDHVVARLTPALLTAVLYQGQAQCWAASETDSSGERLSQAEVCPPALRDELRALLRPPSLKRDAAGELFWQGRFACANGACEEVSVTLPEKSTQPVFVGRVALRPHGYFGARSAGGTPVEEWMVVKDSSWKPPQRYKLMLMMAALGNAEKQFQLGAALLQETDEAAKVEGLKWVEAAAARGHHDAVELLLQSKELLVRSDRDRDKVRVTRCCPVSGR